MQSIIWTIAVVAAIFIAIGVRSRAAYVVMVATAFLAGALFLVLTKDGAQVMAHLQALGAQAGDK